MSGSARLTIVDDLGQELAFASPPGRIVSLVPSITETIIDLGAADKLVGITNYCVRPADAVASIPKVGGTKGFSFEKIDALTPDLIIANKEENRKHHVDRLRRKYPVFVTYPRTLEGAVKTVLDVGRLSGRSLQASEFAEAADAFLTSAAPAVIGVPLRTACLIWRDPWMAVGPDTYMNRLLGRFGFENVFTDKEGRYAETTLEAIAERSPAVVILPDEPYAFGEEDRIEVERFFGSRDLPVQNVLLDGSYLTWFGTRTLKAFRVLLDLKRKALLGRDDRLDSGAAGSSRKES